VFDEFIRYDKNVDPKISLLKLIENKLNFKLKSINKCAKLDEITVSNLFYCSNYFKTKCQVKCRTRTNIENGMVSVFLNNEIHNCKNDSVKIEIDEFSNYIKEEDEEITVDQLDLNEIKLIVDGLDDYETTITPSYGTLKQTIKPSENSSSINNGFQSNE
jgi:hypothetical protein